MSIIFFLFGGFSGTFGWPLFPSSFPSFSFLCSFFLLFSLSLSLSLSLSFSMKKIKNNFFFWSSWVADHISHYNIRHIKSSPRDFCCSRPRIYC